MAGLCLIPLPPSTTVLSPRAALRHVNLSPPFEGGAGRADNIATLPTIRRGRGGELIPRNLGLDEKSD